MALLRGNVTASGDGDSSCRLFFKSSAVWDSVSVCLCQPVWHCWTLEFSRSGPPLLFVATKHGGLSQWECWLSVTSSLLNGFHSPTRYAWSMRVQYVQFLEFLWPSSNILECGDNDKRKTEPLHCRVWHANLKAYTTLDGTCMPWLRTLVVLTLNLL